MPFSCARCAIVLPISFALARLPPLRLASPLPRAVPADRPAVFGEGRLLRAYRTMTSEQRHIMLQLGELFARQQWTIEAVAEKFRSMEKGDGPNGNRTSGQACGPQPPVSTGRTGDQ
jgi:hypothetical protein